MLIEAARCCLLVIDVQEKLLPAVHAPKRVLANSAILMKAANRLGLPILVSEQYPKGLGATDPALSALTAAESFVEKVHFSCMGEKNYTQKLSKLGRDQAVVCGIEAHICVLQTTMDLIAEGIQPFVVADAVSSRQTEDRTRALERLAEAGAKIVTTEMALFEWMRRAGTPEFKDISTLIKDIPERKHD
jgi:isochorismate hydrolase